MQIKAKRPIPFGKETRPAGEIFTVSDALGARLVRRGVAEPVSDDVGDEALSTPKSGKGRKAQPATGEGDPSPTDGE